MARFVSKSAAYRVVAQGDDYMVLANGQRQQTVRPLVADFRIDVLTEDEKQVGVASFDHRGLLEEEGTEQEVSPYPRISGFDSVEAQKAFGWSDDERILVEDTLRNHHMLGIEFKELIPEPTKIPFPTFDDLRHDVGKLVTVSIATGTVEQSLAYEKENGADPYIVEALEEALKEADAPVVIEA